MTKQDPQDLERIARSIEETVYVGGNPANVALWPFSASKQKWQTIVAALRTQARALRPEGEPAEVADTLHKLLDEGSIPAPDEDSIRRWNARVLGFVVRNGSTIVAALRRAAAPCQGCEERDDQLSNLCAGLAERDARIARLRAVVLAPTEEEEQAARGRLRKGDAPECPDEEDDSLQPGDME